MELELSNPSVFKEAFDTISYIVDDIKLDFMREGMFVCALDKSHTTFLELGFNYHLFDSYECSEPVSVYIDTNNFSKILKRCKNTDILKLSIDDGNIILVFEGDATRRYKIRVIDDEYESPQPPIVEAPVKINVPSKLIIDSLKDLSLFAENLKIICDQDYLKISAEGSMGDSLIKYIHGDNVTGEYSSSFTIKMLEDIFRASKLSENVQLELGQDIPLQVNFELVTGDGYLKFLLAPRLNQDDDL